jgi:fibro-slime domain-containing protein
MRTRDAGHLVRRSFALFLVACPACHGESPPREDEGGPGISLSAGESSGIDLDGSADGPRLDFGADTSGGTGPIDTMGDDCDPLVATIRDFQEAHPDFEDYTGDFASLGLVLSDLGPDNTPALNPAYAGPPMITSAASFADWYHDVPGTNMPFPIDLGLMEDTPGMFVYDSSAFFPIDNQGFGNEGNPHNYHFTTEVHTSFEYHGGEVFTFRGDDDLWMFVDGHLAIDLGGLHPAQEASVEMDTLGLTVGETYPMDIFHAERHTDESNFRIVTTIGCFLTPPPQG